MPLPVSNALAEDRIEAHRIGNAVPGIVRDAIEGGGLGNVEQRAGPSAATIVEREHRGQVSDHVDVYRLFGKRRRAFGERN